MLYALLPDSTFFCSIGQAEPTFVCAGHQTPRISTKAVAKLPVKRSEPLSASGHIRVLVIFAKFKDEALGTDRPPAFAGALLDPSIEGSFAHFYHAMSFGQLRIEGTVLARRYVSDRPASAYLAPEPGQSGGYSEFVREVLRKVDADVDLSSFDNDGPDGLPNSGDDDGRVDYVSINVISTPRRFILGNATGIGRLGESQNDYLAADLAASGEPTRISFQYHHGSIQQEGNLAQTAGVMAHEFGHALGLPDLYDSRYETPAEDSAGIGKWGLMGWGAHGWNGDDGPNPFCAWSLEQLGWIGQDNERLIEVGADQMGMVISDLHLHGGIYKILLRNKFIDPHNYYPLYTQEYLLLEHRVRDSQYYNRHLPAEGLLVWHIRAGSRSNREEEEKRVDLVCADGLYADAGNPLGQTPASDDGRDNLDFWAHDVEYRRLHGGNLGDHTDPFDGVRYTSMDPDSNPSTNIGSFLTSASTGLAIENIRRRGDDMVVDISGPRWSGTIREEVHWVGDILVDGDLTIAPEGKLTIYPGSRVRFAGTDRLRSGVDRERCELTVHGDLKIHTRRVIRVHIRDAVGNFERESIMPSPVIFQALVPGESWYGIVRTESSHVDVPGESVELQDSEVGLHEPGQQSSDPRRAQSTAVLTGPGGLTDGFELWPNYPNPFNGTTAIRFALPVVAPVRLRIYNMLGQVVRTLVEGIRPSAVHAITWDGRDDSGVEAASGSYLYRLEIAGKYAEGRVMLLVR